MKKNWRIELNVFLLMSRTTLHGATEMPPAQMMLQHSLNNITPPIHQQHPRSKINAEQHQEKYKQSSKPMLIDNIEQKFLILMK